MTIRMMKNAATMVAAFCFFSAGIQAQPPAQASAPVRDARPAASNAAAIPSGTSAPASMPAKQFASIGERPAIVFDAPSAKAQKTFILTPQQSVEVLVKLDKWVKIRTAENTIGWVESSALDNTRHTQIQVNVADIRAMPNPASALVFEAQRAVILEVTGAAVEGWLPVRHRDGQTGFVRKNQVWGE